MFVGGCGQVHWFMWVCGVHASVWYVCGGVYGCSCV